MVLCCHGHTSSYPLFDRILDLGFGFRVDGSYHKYSLHSFLVLHSCPYLKPVFYWYIISSAVVLLWWLTHPMCSGFTWVLSHWLCMYRCLWTIACECNLFFETFAFFFMRCEQKWTTADCITRARYIYMNRRSNRTVCEILFCDYRYFQAIRLSHVTQGLLHDAWILKKLTSSRHHTRNRWKYRTYIVTIGLPEDEHQRGKLTVWLKDVQSRSGRGFDIKYFCIPWQTLTPDHYTDVFVLISPLWPIQGVC